MNCNCNEREKLMRQIRAYSFAVNEAVLFLDNHPTCRRAMGYYEKYRKLYSEAVAEYERKFAPLTMYGNDTAGGWKWATEPWPWEV